MTKDDFLNKHEEITQHEGQYGALNNDQLDKLWDFINENNLR